MSSVTKFVLLNGVRVLVESIDSVQSAAVGLWCKTGSRHELENEAGITHLIEHMLFKGTPTRTAKQIAESIEGRGGHLNAFTDKESTCYYARILADDTGNAVDVLSDMMRHSLIDPEELTREAKVVLEEIKRGEDEPSDQVHELHLSNRWGNHPLGKPIIGTPASVSGFTRADIERYMDRRYRGENIVLAVAGKADADELLEIATKYLGDIQSGVDNTTVSRPKGESKDVYITKDVEQVHFCIGTDGTSLYDDDLYTLTILDAALGGSMSSRLFQEIREKRGLVYSVGSYKLSYAAGGAFTVYGGTSPEHWDEVQTVTRSEFDKVMATGLDEDELVRTKRLLAGNMVLGLEGMNSRMMRMSKNEIHHERQISIEETLAKLNAVTNEDVMRVAQQILDPALVSTTAIGPAKS
jgi:predicted Zn-dependent peptidase